jgi:hypothetical protein
MAVVFAPKQYVSNVFTLANPGFIYDVTGSVAENKPTTDGSTVFNIDIPAGYNFVTNSFKFYNNTTQAEITATVTTPVTGKITATFASGALSAATEYKMTLDLTV